MNALISVFVVKANVIPSSYYSEVAAGEFYLYNVTQQQFLTSSPSMSATPVAPVGTKRLTMYLSSWATM